MKWLADHDFIEIITFSPEDAKRYTDAAYKAAWEYQQKRFPDVTPKLRELYTK